MTRKVSLWIVLALVGALAAMTVAVVGLAAHDHRDGGTASGPLSAGAWPHAGNGAQDERGLPMMGDVRGGWGNDRDAPVLPWVLFAVATGTAAGLLVAWSPWKTAEAGTTAGPSGGGDTSTQPAAETARQTQTDESQTAILKASNSETRLPEAATAADATLATNGEAAAGDPAEVAEATEAVAEPQVDSPDADSDRPTS
jgi:hypothetical protein